MPSFLEFFNIIVISSGRWAMGYRLWVSRAGLTEPFPEPLLPIAYRLLPIALHASTYNNSDVLYEL